ncbi:MAG: nitrous oxide reductase family maturation protein NosD [Gammaproteobacteria bacterium]|nr:nitrous oxide reductase family maturation protein NosD [Gammaproteobacteria bacterium]
MIQTSATKNKLHYIICLIWLLLSPQAQGLPPLQMFVDVTPPHGILRPPPGTYAGPVTINKPLTLDGGGRVTIDGGGQGTVLHIRASGSVVRGVHLTNSGDSHNGLNAGLMLEANDTLIENNIIDNSLFGIHIKQSNNNTIRANQISSKGDEPSLRGDGIRMWYSRGNLIEDNHFDRIRDLLITNSLDNRIIGNRISNSRMGMELVFSPNNKIIDNRISHNNSGIAIIYSNGLLLQGNHILHLRNITGSALSIKDSSQVVITQNQIIHCAMGMIANAPIHPENIIFLDNNLFAYNDIAMYFHGEKGGHLLHNNRFNNNNTEILVSSHTSALDNDWRGNYWDRYEGFDQNGDGIGDTPHSILLYSDRIWMDRPMTKFFRSSPALELVDFVERLAPFSTPRLVLRDPSPRVSDTPDKPPPPH